MKTLRRNVALIICFVTLAFTLALGGFQVYRSTVDFSVALRRAAEDLERAFRNLQIEEQRLRDLESKKEKLSQVPVIDVSRTMPADELREFLLNFFGQDVIDVQEISIRCEITEPLVFERRIPTFVVSVRSGLTAASPEVSGAPEQAGQELRGQTNANADAVPSQVPGGNGNSRDSGGTSVGGQ